MRECKLNKKQLTENFSICSEYQEYKVNFIYIKKNISFCSRRILRSKKAFTQKNMLWRICTLLFIRPSVFFQLTVSTLRQILILIVSLPTKLTLRLITLPYSYYVLYLKTYLQPVSLSKRTCLFKISDDIEKKNSPSCVLKKNSLIPVTTKISLCNN